MVEGVFSGLTAIKSALDIVGYIKNLDTTVKIDESVSKLYKEVLAAYQDQLALVERNRELETKLIEAEKWKAERETYELKRIGISAFAYMLKPSSRGSQPPHWVCQNCYDDRKIKIIQARERNRETTFLCPACGSEVNPSSEAYEPRTTRLSEMMPGVLKWLD